VEAVVNYFEVISMCFSGEFEEPPAPRKTPQSEQPVSILKFKPPTLVKCLGAAHFVANIGFL
jgi:hypothetical protein